MVGLALLGGCWGFFLSPAKLPIWEDGGGGASCRLVGMDVGWWIPLPSARIHAHKEGLPGIPQPLWGSLPNLCF